MTDLIGIVILWGGLILFAIAGKYLIAAAIILSGNKEDLHYYGNLCDDKPPPPPPQHQWQKDNWLHH